MDKNTVYKRTLSQAKERLTIVQEQEKEFNKQVSNNNKQIKQISIKNKKLAKKISSHMKYMNQLVSEITEKSKKEEPQWEILAYNNPNVFTDVLGGNIVDAKGSGANYAILKNFPIHSVKRLSDGEVIEIHKTHAEDKNTKHSWIVSELTVKDNRCFANGVNILEPYLRIIKDNPKYNPLDIENAISLLAECGYEIKAAPNTSALKSMQQAPKEEQVPIKVYALHYYGGEPNYHNHTLICSERIPVEKYDALKKLIQDFLNSPLGEIINYEQYKARKYTESELLQARRDAFDAAREGELDYSITRNPISLSDAQYIYKNKYKDNEDYINSLK